MSSNEWTWSKEHNDYYRVTYDGNGKPVHHWAKNRTNDAQSEAESSAAQSSPTGEAAVPSSGNSGSPTAAKAEPPEPLPAHVRARMPNLMAGTPNKGWYDHLDPSYRMRTGHEAKHFFARGRVFSMLWSETASETYARAGTVNTAITVGRFGQNVYSQIRRFIVVKVEHGFVYAIAIYTYTGRGTLKPGCIASEHSAVFLQGSGPTYFSGERDGPHGISKEPIEVVPVDNTINMDPASRVRFGKTYSIEWNVKVKDIGKVSPKYMPRLNRYWIEHMSPSDEPDLLDDAPISYGSSSGHNPSDDSSYTATPGPHHSSSVHTAPRTMPQAQEVDTPGHGHPLQAAYQPNPYYQAPQQQPTTYTQYPNTQPPNNAFQYEQFPNNQYQNDQYPNNQYPNNQYPNNQYPNNPYQYPPYYPPH